MDDCQPGHYVHYIADHLADSTLHLRDQALQAKVSLVDEEALKFDNRTAWKHVHPLLARGLSRHRNLRCTKLYQCSQQ